MVEGCELYEPVVMVLIVTPSRSDRGEVSKAGTSTSDNYMCGCFEGATVIVRSVPYAGVLQQTRTCSWCSSDRTRNVYLMSKDWL